MLKFKELESNMRNITLSLVIILTVLFCIGFILNGWLQTKFEIGLIWQGVGCLLGVGATGLGYHVTNSVFNSPPGTMPPKPNQIKVSSTIKEEDL